MTNLFLVITIATNISIVRIDCVGTSTSNLYSIQEADHLPIEPDTNWCKSWIFQGNANGTNTFYGYVENTNRLYRVQDLGPAF